MFCQMVPLFLREMCYHNIVYSAGFIDQFWFRVFVQKKEIRLHQLYDNKEGMTVSCHIVITIL